MSNFDPDFPVEVPCGLPAVRTDASVARKNVILLVKYSNGCVFFFVKSTDRCSIFRFGFVQFDLLKFPVMAPKSMKAMKAMRKATTKKTLSKTGIVEAISTETELKKSDCVKVLNALATVAAKEVKKTGKLVIPGVAMLKTRNKSATKAGKKLMFGEMRAVKAQPAKTIVKAFPVAAIKKCI